MAEHTGRVVVETYQCEGPQIYCRACKYEGPADIITLTKKKERTRGMERCPNCKSMNIRELEVEKEMEPDVNWQLSEWKGCYPSDWRKIVVPDAMAHPAKFSSRLIRRIYEHLFDEGWVEMGDRILDPFGGVALGSLHAMEKGLAWTGVELEEKFVDLGMHNISHWNVRYKAMPHWSGLAVLLQGDSRELLKVIGRWKVDSGQWAVDGVVSSPPYADSVNAGKGGIDWEKAGRPDRLEHSENRHAVQGADDHEMRYGFTEGQLGAMKGADFDAAISSPPFRQSEGGTPEPKPGGVIDDRLYARHAAGNSAAEGYGATDGQLANMKEGNFDGVVSSPPYEAYVVKDRSSHLEKDRMAEKGIDNKNGSHGMTGNLLAQETYGHSDGQLADSTGDDFWLAARRVVEQTYLALRPGGHAVWVCKDFVRNKERVPFSDQWRQLCEAVGFVTLHEHHALLVHKKGTSLTLGGDLIEHRTEHKSFFRRVAENNGSPRIDWEVVWCMEKPKNG